MSPTHANKKGVRYRYYTSHALLQRRKEHAGSVPRVSAPEMEALVCEALRREVLPAEEISDKNLVEQHLAKVIIRHERIEVEPKGYEHGDEVSAGMLAKALPHSWSTQKTAFRLR
jgi:site-specific DNA recombinase